MGTELRVRYPRVESESALAAASAALPAWRDAGPDVRTGICLEILERLNRRASSSGTSGCTPPDSRSSWRSRPPGRTLKTAGSRRWRTRRGHDGAVRARHVGRRLLAGGSFGPEGVRGRAARSGPGLWPARPFRPGTAIQVCSPVSSPGNPVVVKPHPRAVLPLAVTVAVAREVLIEEGLRPRSGVARRRPADRPQAKVLADRSARRIIDYTGSREFGEWLEENARQARVYAEKTGVNCVVVDSTDDFAGLCRNLAHSLSLYSGQMCTAPQVIFVPAEGIATEEGRVPLSGVEDGLVAAIDALVADPERAAGVLAVVGDAAVEERTRRASEQGQVLRATERIPHPEFPGAVLHSPLVLGALVGDRDRYGVEQFGPISFVVQTADTTESFHAVAELACASGSLTTSLYTTSTEVLSRGRDLALRTGSTLSVNLTGELFVNQSAAFSDFHGTGNNPSANTALVDTGFVADRFAVVEIRRPVTGLPDARISGPHPLAPEPGQ